MTLAPLGWSGYGHIGYPAYAILLMASLAPPRLPPQGSILAEFSTYLTSIKKSVGHIELLPAIDEQQFDLLVLLSERMSLLTLSAARQESMREVARKVANLRIARIVEQQRRGAYDRAAKLAVALSATYCLSGEDARAMQFPRELLLRYPRHSAFRSNLQSEWKASPVLKGLKL